MKARLKERRKIEPGPMVQIGLNVPYYSQQQSMWCWAACIEMVITYYNTAAEQQCSIVNHVLGRSDCCSKPGSGWCNTSISGSMVGPAYPQYQITANETYGPVALAYVQQFINANAVLEASLNWTAGGGHLALIIGYDNASTDLLVNDPWPTIGQFWGTYAYVSSAYGQGRWNDTWVLSH
ncbi:papain-like cysteine protease family protein (plasmid) [Sorangium sp. So ce119]|uniref:papain-like cysteine protease family protein n=1 Tax=Sorangium sp. So ce119 TaxID=3133279 RepID=UPI003F5EDFCF